MKSKKTRPLTLRLLIGLCFWPMLIAVANAQVADETLTQTSNDTLTLRILGKIIAAPEYLIEVRISSAACRSANCDTKLWLDQNTILTNENGSAVRLQSLQRYKAYVLSDLSIRGSVTNRLQTLTLAEE